ncbi:CvpA family protein [Marinigracilibium pacificum]|uniref:CvpA family protein n=1 Tax=Marinigracilibium pacificum TaxID=2729599 RepID=A0A848J602_9BACT|nr:CvpA family protein [Marinigracilibium pacificum]
MAIIDIVIILLIGFGAYNGFRKGFLLEFAGLVAFILAIFLGFKLLHVSIGVLSTYFEGLGPLIPLLAFIIIFVGVIFLVNIVVKLFKSVLDKTILGNVDQLAGAIFGAFKWALGISIILWIITILDVELPQTFIGGSMMMPMVEPIAPEIAMLLGKVIPSVNDMFYDIRDMFSQEEA